MKICSLRNEHFLSRCVYSDISPQKNRDSPTIQLVSPMILMHSRLRELGLETIDVGGAGDFFFRSISHQWEVRKTKT